MRSSVLILLLSLLFSASSEADECPDMRESNSPVCVEILEKKLFENTVSFTENGQKHTYAKAPYTYVFTDVRADPEPTDPEITRFDQASKQSVAIDAFPNCFYVTPELFEYNGDLYAVYPDRNLNFVYPDTNEIAVFKFDDEKFKGIGHFRKTFVKSVLERGETPDLCQKILDKKYTKSVSEPLRNLMTDDEMQKIVFSQIRSDGLRFQILPHGYRGTRADYNNDGGAKSGRSELIFPKRIRRSMLPVALCPINCRSAAVTICSTANIRKSSRLTEKTTC